MQSLFIQLFPSGYVHVAEPQQLYVT